jgi:hypothetical protein
METKKACLNYIASHLGMLDLNPAEAAVSEMQAPEEKTFLEKANEATK